VRPPVQLFCACDVFLVKAIQRATRLGQVIELAQQKCSRWRLLK
jgi:hypothetical protein